MKRVLAVLAVVVIVASVATGVLVWRLSRGHGPDFPEISAYSHGELTTVGPYRYCNVLRLDECENPETIGQLAVDART